MKYSCWNPTSWGVLLSNAVSSSKFDLFDTRFAMDGWSPALAVEGEMLGLRNFASSKPRRLNAPRLALVDDDQAGHGQAARVLLPAFSADGTKQYYAHRSCARSLPREQVPQSTYTPFSARTPSQSLVVSGTGSPTSAPYLVECDPVPHVIPDGGKRACMGVQLPSSSSTPLLWSHVPLSL